MNVEQYFGWPALLAFGLFFLAFLAHSRQRRRKDLAFIEKRFEGVKPIITGFGVTYYGREADSAPLRRRKGFLLVMPDRLFFRSRAGEEWEAFSTGIRDVTHGVRHKDCDLRQSVMIVDYEAPDGDGDRVAFQVPYMPQWIKAIEIKLMKIPPRPPR
jgi:hypothetical protein